MILAAYRPGSQDAADPQVASALEQAEHDPALKAWLVQHTAFQTQVRECFREIPAPDDLSRRILSPSNIVPLSPIWHRRALWAAAAGILVLASLSAFWFRGPGEGSFAVFQTRMAQAALRQYRMDIVTNDLAHIRQFLTRNRAPADFQLSGPLAKLAPVGAGLLSWQDQRVSMVCLESGAGNEATILYLFVVARSAVARPPTSIPEFRPVNKLGTASWIEGNHAYLLAAPSDAERLRRYF